MQKTSFKKKSLKKILGLLAATSLTSLSTAAWSNGYILPEQNVTNLGMAYAGTASLAEDASTNFYNAAGLTRLCHEEIVVGSVMPIPHYELHVSNATSTTGAPFTPNAGTVRPANFSVIPFMHWGMKLDDCWAIGTSFVSTFGSKTDYTIDSLVRYTATRSKLITVDIAPSIAYRFCNGLSLGGGIDLVYAYARIASQIGIWGNSIIFDGNSDLYGSRWAVGYHLAALYEWDDCTRFGLTYRSRVNPKLKGDSFVQTTFSSPILTQGARAALHFPDSVTVSAYHALTDCVAVMADFQWIHWNVYKSLDIVFDDGSQLIQPQNWDNSYRAAIGGTYQVSDCMQLKAGVSYDKTPTNDFTRNIYIPDEDQVAVGVGLKYWLARCLSVDFGYVHVFFENANINQPAPISVGAIPQGHQTVTAVSKNRIDVIGFQVTWDLR